MFHTAFVPFQTLFCDYIHSTQKHDMQVLQYHDTYEIYLQTQGERYLFLDGVCYLLRPGDFYLVKPFEMHYGQSLTSEFYERYVLNFPDEKLLLLLTPYEQQLLMESLETGVYHLGEKNFTEMLHIFRSLHSCCNQEGFLSEKLKYSYVLQLLLLIKGLGSNRKNQTSHWAENPEIMSAIHYINTHYKESLNLDQVIQHIHMSKYHFCRLFKKAVGATFVEYLNGIRMAKVQQLLTETDLSLTEIAAQTGYASGVHMTRVFRSFYQMTPSEFRKQKRQPSH